MKQFFFRGLGLISLFSFLIYSCQIEADKPDLSTTEQGFSSKQFQEYFQKINSQFNNNSVLSSRGIIPPSVSSACMPAAPGIGKTCSTALINRSVNLTPNPTCPVCTTANVAFNVRVCYDFIQNPGVPTFSFSFWNFIITSVSSDCDICLRNLPGHGYDVVLDQMTYQASLICEAEYVFPYVNTWHPPCVNNSYYSSDFLRELCYQWCYDITTGNLSQLSCGSKCCQRTRTFCWEPAPPPLGTVKPSPPIFQQIGSSNCGIYPTICNGLPLPCDDRPCGIVP
jgi:hypothetical protein